MQKKHYSHCTSIWENGEILHVGKRQWKKVCSKYMFKTAGEQPTGHRLSLLPQTLTYYQTAIRTPGLPFNGLHPLSPVIHVSSWMITHLLTPKRWKAELACMVADNLPMKTSGHVWTID